MFIINTQEILPVWQVSVIAVLISTKYNKYEKNADKKIERSLLLVAKKNQESVSCIWEIQKVECTSTSNNSNFAPRKEDEKHQTFIPLGVKCNPVAF